MISQIKAIEIAKRQVSGAYKVNAAVLKHCVWYIGLQRSYGKTRPPFEVQIDAKTGRVIGGAGGC